MSGRAEVPDWERLLAQASVLQTKVPGAVLVGGTAAALHAGHRFSLDHDHVVRDLDRHYDEAVAALETIVGWRTTRRVKGKLVLGRVGGIEAGLRNQRRAAPLETTTIDAPSGRRLRVPTVPEMLRIKAFLLVERGATRDYLDVAALSDLLGPGGSVGALESMNALYAEFAGEGGDMLTSVLVRLANPEPYDLTSVDLGEYRGIVAPWNDWEAVVAQCRQLAVALLA
ncbi:MAG: hypothetical protein FJZ01_11745 [Candidatus Sericytochromatia bacterium]|nr:hypothetical protein [Candidatus Tanganyikabacteria bacterium]